MRLIETIPCEDDDGNQYSVEIWQEFKSLQPLNGPKQEVPGMKSARISGTSDRVNVLDHPEFNTFQIVMNDRVIRRIGTK